MHEMAAARRLVAEALERMERDGLDRVASVEIVLGSSAGLSPESVCQHFELAARGTPAEGAAVHVTLEPGRYWCFDCMFEFSSRAHGGGSCPRCGGSAISIDREELAYVRSVAEAVA
jgi:hydrogenase nickel incorporation protein HypA/HybF